MTAVNAPVPGGNAAPTPSKAPAQKASDKASKASGNGEKKPRAPRVDYGYAESSIIHIQETETEPKFNGKRKEYYELLVAHDGKTVGEFNQNWPDKNDSPRGWVRFFCQNGNATLERVKPADDGKEKS